MKNISAPEIAKLGIGFALGYLTYKLVSVVGADKQTDRLQNKKNRNIESDLQIQQAQKQIDAQQQQNIKQLRSLDQLREILVHKSASFEIQTIKTNKNHMSPDTVILTKKCLLNFLTQTQGILDYQQLVQIVLENRKARRQIIAEIDSKYETYFKFVCTLDQNIKYVLQKAQKDFAVFLSIDYNCIMDSIAFHIDHPNYQPENNYSDGQWNGNGHGSAQNQQLSNQFRVQIVEIMSILRQNQSNYMPLFSSPLPKDRLIRIIQYQSQLLKNQNKHLLQLTKKMGLQTKQEQQALPLFLTCYIQDITWVNHQIQSQQMSVQDSEMDAQVRKCFNKFKRIRDELIAELHMSIQDDIIIE